MKKNKDNLNSEMETENIEVFVPLIVDDKLMYKKFLSIEKKYRKVNGVEWDRSISFFYSPILILFCSIFYFVFSKSNISLISIISIIILNIAFFIYRGLIYKNQFVVIYPNRIRYKFGVIKQQKVIMHFSSDIKNIYIDDLKGNKIKKMLNLDYSDVIIESNDGKMYVIPFLAEPDEFSKLILKKKNEYLNELFEDVENEKNKEKENKEKSLKLVKKKALSELTNEVEKEDEEKE